MKVSFSLNASLEMKSAAARGKKWSSAKVAKIETKGHFFFFSFYTSSCLTFVISQWDFCSLSYEIILKAVPYKCKVHSWTNTYSWGIEVSKFLLSVRHISDCLANVYFSVSNVHCMKMAIEFLHKSSFTKEKECFVKNGQFKQGQIIISQVQLSGLVLHFKPAFLLWF